jgi:hypothetical protein
MINKLIFSLLISGNLWAALPKNSDIPSVYEVLSLPEANQLQVALVHRTSLFPELVKIVENSQQAMNYRWRALSLAVALNPAQALSLVEKQMRAPEWFMRNVALVVAEKYYPDRALAMARNLLKDKALVVRSAAVEVLAKKLTIQDRDLLWAELSAPRNQKNKKPLWIKGKIVSILGRDPLPREASIFQSLLVEDDLKIKVASIKALEKIYEQKLGNSKDSIAKKAELWRKYALKASPQKNNLN